MCKWDSLATSQAIMLTGAAQDQCAKKISLVSPI